MVGNKTLSKSYQPRRMYVRPLPRRIKYGGAHTIIRLAMRPLRFFKICCYAVPPLEKRSAVRKRRHFRRVTNPATAECNMSGCMEDTSLWIASFSSDRLDGPDRYTRDFKYPHNQKTAGVKSETEEAMGTCSAC
ncbi:hypothetical protein TNCV_3363751 [Trichonephila clavipes]|nr:hypothetical protein TNCV_3363751 [Trichonephila clavipes]